MFDSGFNLRKWNSNSPELLSRIASSCGKSGNDSVMCTKYGTGPHSLLGPIVREQASRSYLVSYGRVNQIILHSVFQK